MNRLLDRLNKIGSWELTYNDISNTYSLWFIDLQEKETEAIIGEDLTEVITMALKFAEREFSK